MRSLWNTGGVGVSTSTLGVAPESSGCPEGVLPSAAGARTLPRQLPRRRPYYLAATAWVCPKARAVGNSIHYRACGKKKASGLRSPMRVVDCRFRQRGHDFVSRGVRVQTVFSQVAFEKTLVIDHGAEIIKINAVDVRGDVAFQPAVEFENFLRRAAGKHIHRLRRVVVHGQHRREHDADVVGTGEFGHGRIVRLDIRSEFSPASGRQTYSQTAACSCARAAPTRTRRGCCRHGRVRPWTHSPPRYQI